MSLRVIRSSALAFVVASLGAGAGVAACGILEGGSSTDEQGGAVDSSVDALSTDGGGASDADSGCTLTLAPATAISATNHAFTSFTSSVPGQGDVGWVSIGYDRDGLCTTSASTDVCKRYGNAAASAQVDGVDGIDNAWGKGIAPLLAGTGRSFATGFLTTDASGSGSLVLVDSMTGLQLVVPVRGTKLDLQDASATLSAIVPREGLAAAFTTLIGQIDVGFCGATGASFLEQARGYADILQDGTQSPGATCDALSLGALLTGVTSTTAPAIDAGTSPCL